MSSFTDSLCNDSLKNAKLKIINHCLNNIKPKLSLATQLKLHYQSVKGSYPDELEADYNLTEQEKSLINNLFLKEVQFLEKKFLDFKITESGFPGAPENCEEKFVDASTVSVDVISYLTQKVEELRNLHETDVTEIASLDALSKRISQHESETKNLYLEVPSGAQVPLDLLQKKMVEELQVTEQKVKENRQILETYESIPNFDQYLAMYIKINNSIDMIKKTFEENPIGNESLSNM